jgi:hypothetical protein
MILTHYKQQDEHSHMCSHAAHSIAVVHAALGSCISDKQQQTQTVGCEEAREEGCPLARGARHRWQWHAWLAAAGGGWLPLAGVSTLHVPTCQHRWQTVPAPLSQ